MSDEWLQVGAKAAILTSIPRTVEFTTILTVGNQYVTTEGGNRFNRRREESGGGIRSVGAHNPWTPLPILVPADDPRVIDIGRRTFKRAVTNAYEAWMRSNDLESARKLSAAVQAWMEVKT